ncbi:hypothetical protein H4S06_000616 [Coemansia sp. BCRC 34490]|nr:hypothetical protein H4S06_000616 [Coemansia sp. BCRC 34490]
MITEYCGETIKELARKRRLSNDNPEEFEAIVCNAIRQASACIAKAYSAGILHRNIAAGNIVIKNGKVKVIDWGYVKLLDRVKITGINRIEKAWHFSRAKILFKEAMSSLIVGTPLFMSIQTLLGTRSRGLMHDIESMFYVAIYALGVFYGTIDDYSLPSGFQYIDEETKSVSRLGWLMDKDTYLEQFGTLHCQEATTARHVDIDFARANVEATSLLTHVTLAIVRVFTPSKKEEEGLKLSDKEYELALGCLLQALRLDEKKTVRQMAQVHAVIVDHLSRILVVLFTRHTGGGMRQTSEHTRELAIECWRALFVGVASVHVPATHSQQGRGTTATADPSAAPSTVTLAEYAESYLPPDYLSLCVSELLNNAELAQDQRLRMLALDTLDEIQRSGGSDGYSPGVLSNKAALVPIFPGVASTLVRIALAQEPKQPRDTRQQRQQLNRSAEENWRSPPAAVRARALRVLRTSLVIVYDQPVAEQQQQQQQRGEEDVGMAEEWAHRARQDVGRSIVGSNSEEDTESVATKVGDESSPVDDIQRIQQVLWRLSSLRHTNVPRITGSLIELFAAVVMDCAALQHTQCMAVGIESCLVIGAGSDPETPQSTGVLDRLRDECRSRADGPVSRRVSLQLQNALSLFDRYVADGTDQQRRDVMCLLLGYIRVLGASRMQPLLASWWKTRGLWSFLQSLHISLPGTSLLITEVSSDTATVGLSKEKPQAGSVEYVLDRYRDPDLARTLDRFVAQISEVFTPTGLASLLLSLLLDNDRTMHPPVLWLLSRVADSQSKPGDLGSACQTFFQYCADFFSRPEDSSSHSAPSNGTVNTTTITTTTSNTLHSCMVLDAVSHMIPAVGPGVAYYLDFLLFPLLQTTTSRTPLLQHQGRAALEVLAHTTGVQSVAGMLKDNVDYIVEGCSQQIRSIELHHNVFQILAGAVNLVGAPILPYMDDVAEDTLDVCERLATTTASDDGDNDVEGGEADGGLVSNALVFLEAVTRTVAAAHREARTMMLEDSSAGKHVGEADADPIAKVIGELDEAEGHDRMAELINLDSIASDDEVGDSSNDVVVQGDKQTEEEDDLAGNPLAIKITLVTQNFLSSESTSHQLVSLKILQNTLEALQDTRDLLPLINEVWPALVHRLSKNRDAFYVTLAACDVIEIVCRLGETWMRRRVRDDLWIHLDRVLREASLESVATRASERSLVLRVLRTMRTVVCRVPLDDQISWDLSWLCLRLLESNVLQQSVLDLLRAMVPAYGDKLWLVLSKYGPRGASSVSPDSIPDLGIPVGHIRVSHDIFQKLEL